MCIRRGYVPFWKNSRPLGKILATALQSSGFAVKLKRHYFGPKRSVKLTYFTIKVVKTKFRETRAIMVAKFKKIELKIRQFAENFSKKQ